MESYKDLEQRLRDHAEAWKSHSKYNPSILVPRPTADILISLLEETVERLKTYKTTLEKITELPMISDDRYDAHRGVWVSYPSRHHISRDIAQEALDRYKEKV